MRGCDIRGGWCYLELYRFYFYFFFSPSSPFGPFNLSHPLGRNFFSGCCLLGSKFSTRCRKLLFGDRPRMCVLFFVSPFKLSFLRCASLSPLSGYSFFGDSPLFKSTQVSHSPFVLFHPPLLRPCGRIYKYNIYIYYIGRDNEFC